MKVIKYYLSINISHNSSASIMKDGEIIFGACEERYRKIKNIVCYPKYAIKDCLNFANISGKELTKVAFTSYDHDPVLIKSKHSNNFTIKEFWDFYNNKFYNASLNQKIKYFNWLLKNKRFQDKEDLVNYKFIKVNKEYFKNKKKYLNLYKNSLIETLSRHIKIDKEKIIFIDHHTCHAYYSYFGSPIRDKNTNIITLDSWGDGRNQTVWIAKKNKLKLISQSKENDIGRIYTFATLLLGMRPDEHEFKVMGMAPYAKKKYLISAYNEIKNISRVKNMRIIEHKRPKDLFNFLINVWKGHRFDNIAGAVQYFTENLCKKLIKNIYNKTKSKHFVLSGGIALNIKMNQEISKLKFVKEIFVCGSAGDESLAIGGNYYLNRENYNKPLNDLYLGNNINLEKKNFNIRRNNFYNFKVVKSKKTIAKLLSNNKIIATASGRSEFGVRALGNRSILTNPSNINNVKKINKAIKSRDFWMPFALSILEKDHKKFINNPKNLSSPFMTITFDTFEKNRNKIICGTHPYDFTVRPQFVSKKNNLTYYNLINEFKKTTGIPALLNTSFNLHGEPIVETTKDAIRTFLNSDLDYLWLYNTYLLSKK